MNQIFDFFNRPEKPQIILTKPNGEELCEISNYSDLSISMRYNDISEIEFKIFNEDDKYGLIKGKKYILLIGYGIFIIDEVLENDNGLSKYKSVKCKSVDFELSYKRITLEPKTYKLYDPLDPNDTLMGRVINLLPSWSIGTIDSQIRGQYRYFDIEDTDIMSFLYTKLEDAFQCVVEMDINNRKINIKAVENVGRDTNIYLSFDNLVESIEVTELSNEIVTNLLAYGGNNLNIRGVNPTGSNAITNFEYFKTTEWMTQGLITALDNYTILYNSKKSSYENYLLLYKQANQDLDNLNTELILLQNELNALITVRTERIRAGLDITSLYNDVQTKEGQINTKENEINDKKVQLQSYINSLSNIVEELSLENNFTGEQIIELDKSIISYTYQNEAYIVTDTMTEKEKIEQAELLLEDAQKILGRLSQPRFSFKVNLTNFIKLYDFKSFTDKLELASSIYIEFDENSVVETRLISYEYNWDSNDLNLEFTSKYRTNDSTYTYEEMYKKSVSAGVSVGFSKFQYNDWSRGNKDVVTSFINSSLDASLNNIISSTDQNIIMDNNGFRCRQIDGQNGYLDEQLHIVNNMIAFTTDSWRTNKMCIGKIQDDKYGEIYGICNNKIIRNEVRE